VAGKDIHLVYQHDDFYVVAKPAGSGFHDEKDEQGAVETGFFNQCCGVLGETLYPVHRLDKITSGLLILARNKDAATWFQQAFEQKAIQKLYFALGSKKPKKKQGSILGDMSKARNGQWKLIKSLQNPAVTRFFSWGVESNLSGLRGFLLLPETGKTHQIRVALKSLGTPILGDMLYGGEASDRGYLHAFGLKFDYRGEPVELFLPPRQGQFYQVAFEQLADKLSNGFELNWPKK